MRILEISCLLLLLGSIPNNSKLLNLADLDNTLINETLYTPLYNMSVEWGVYKPDLYFGIRNR